MPGLSQLRRIRVRTIVRIDLRGDDYVDIRAEQFTDILQWCHRVTCLARTPRTLKLSR
jgi:hypothetical protein